MKQIHFQEKYPITVLELAKSETPYASAAAIAEYFKACIASTPRVSYIGSFDHFAHTESVGGEIAPAIKAALNVLAVRPRSIGIVDVGDHFVISFMDAPMKAANEAMQAWALALKTT
jgi:hypothetical protein